MIMRALRLIAVCALIAVPYSAAPLLVRVVHAGPVSADADLASLLSALDDSVKAANDALNKTKSDVDAANEVIGKLTKKTPEKVTADTLGDLSAAVKYLKDKSAPGGDRNAIVAIESRLQGYVKDESSIIPAAAVDLKKRIQAVEDNPAYKTDATEEQKRKVADAKDVLASLDRDSDKEPGRKQAILKLVTAEPGKQAPLAEAVASFFTYAVGVAGKIDGALDATGVPKRTDRDDEDTLRKTLADALPDFHELADLTTKLPAKNILEPDVTTEFSGLEKLFSSDAQAAFKALPAAYEARVTSAASQVDKVTNNTSGTLPGLVEGVLDATRTRATAVSALVKELISQKDIVDLADRVKQNRDVANQTDKVRAGVALIIALYKGDKDYSGLVQALNVKLESLGVVASTLEGAINALDDFMVGSADGFVTDQIRLFYFTNVKQIISALNRDYEVFPKEADTTAATANSARSKLIQAEIDLAEQRGVVNDIAPQLRYIRQQIDQIRAEQRLAGQRAQDADRLLTALTNQKAKVDADLTTEKAKPQEQQDPTKIQKLTKQSGDLQQKISDQTTYKADADSEKETADDAADKLKDNQAELPKRQADAEAKLRAAEVQVRKLRNDIAADAIDEVGAFAATRENTPLLFSKAQANHPDPVRRVDLYAFPDAKTINIRGRPGDVGIVKDVIAGFDRPAPQALLTLWTLQINGADSTRLDRIMHEVDEELRGIRGNVASIQEKLRDAVSAEVSRVATRMRDLTGGTASSLQLERRLARYFFYSTEVRERLGFAVPCADRLDEEYKKYVEGEGLLRIAANLVHLEGLVTESASNMRETQRRALASQIALLAVQVRADLVAYWRSFDMCADLRQALKADLEQTINRSADGERLHGLSFSTYASLLDKQGQALQDEARAKARQIEDRGDVLRQSEYITHWTLPDPASLTTAGQVLFVLSLARRSSRLQILNDFTNDLVLEQSKLGAAPPSVGATTTSRENASTYVHDTTASLLMLQRSALHWKRTTKSA